MNLVVNFISLLLCICFTIPVAQSQQEINKMPIIDIGIMDIFDSKLKLNHNQAFKKFLSKNSIKSGGKTANIDLVDHQSTSKIALNVIMSDCRVFSTFYQQGKILRRDTFGITAIEKSRIAWKVNFGLVQTPAGITIAWADSTYLTNFKSSQNNHLQIGYIVEKINDKQVDNDLSRANELLVFDSDKIVSVDVHNPVTGISERFYLPTFSTQIVYWNYPLNEMSLIFIFKGLYSNLRNMQSEIGMLIPALSEKSTKDILKPRNSEKKCQAQEQLAIHQTKTHPVYVTTRKNSVYSQGVSSSNQTDKSLSETTQDLVSTSSISCREKIEEVFDNESFYYPMDNSNIAKWETGDAALYVIQHYNYNQNESYLMKHSSVSDNLKKTVEKLSGPYYNKPGVWANYFAAGVDYELHQNYSAALNQYYASLRKIDDIICSELTKVRAKQIALERIAFCSKKLGQAKYSDFLEMASECLKLLDAPNSDLLKGHNNFYDFSKEIQDVCVGIEKKLKEQRNERATAIIGSVVSVAAGVATVRYDAGLATSFLTNAVDILDQNAKFNIQTDNLLSETTETIVINLPAELEIEERSPYEILATSYINYALTHSSTPNLILEKISEYAEENSTLKNSAERLKVSWRQTGKLDQTELVNILLKSETIFYRYEKRGLKVPEIAVP